MCQFFVYTHLLLLLLVAGGVDANEAKADRAGSCSEGALLCRWSVNWTDPCVDVEEGRDISCPRDGREGRSSSEAVLKEGRSRTCSADRGRMGSRRADGRGR